MSKYGETRSYDNGPWWGWWPRVNEGRDAHEVFESADVNVYSDAYLHKRPGRLLLTYLFKKIYLISILFEIWYLNIRTVSKI